MPRIWIRTFCWAVSVVLLAGVGNLPAQSKSSQPSETLLPDTTQGFFAISNVDRLSEHWDKTQLGHLMADPLMEPFTKDIKRQFEDRWSSIHERLGITLEDMRGVPGGDAALALIAPQPGTAALVIVVDVTGKLPQGRQLIEKARATQLQRGGKQSEMKVEGCPDAVLQFDLPEAEEDKEATKSEPAGRGDDKAAAGDKARQEPPARQAFYCITGNLLVMTDNGEIMRGILGRALGRQKGDSLADHKAFQSVMRRCRKDYGDAMPQMRWFMHPLGYAEAARVSTPEGRRRKGKSILEVLRNQGIGGVQGIGGFVDFAAEGYELVHRTAIYAPPPYEKSMKMAVLPNRTDFAPSPGCRATWPPMPPFTSTFSMPSTTSGRCSTSCLARARRAPGATPSTASKQTPTGRGSTSAGS